MSFLWRLGVLGGQFETFWRVLWCFCINNGVGDKTFPIFKRNAFSGHYSFFLFFFVA